MKPSRKAEKPAGLRGQRARGGRSATKAPRRRRTIRWVRPWMYPAQRDAIFHAARYVVVEAATKVGKTVSCLFWLLEQAALNGGPGRNFWWVAPSTKQATIAFTRAVAYLPKRWVHVHHTHRTIRLPNGSTIWFLTGEKPDLLYGEDVYAAVIDEATRVRQESWTAVRTTLTFTNGPVRIIGNVRGKKNWAYKMARRAERGDTPTMHHARLTAYDAAAAGILDYAEIEDARDQMEEDDFKQLFLAEATEGTSNPFGHDAIRACRVARYSTAPTAALGVDLARKHDWTVIIGLDADFNVTFIQRFRQSWPKTEDAIVAAGSVGKFKIGTTLDATGLGDPVLAHVEEKGALVQGYVYSPVSKQHLMLRLKSRIQSGLIGFPTEEGRKKDDPAVQLNYELHAFEVEYTERNVVYSVPDDEFDDCVNALALAVYQLETNPPQKRRRPVKAALGPQGSPYSV